MQVILNTFNDVEVWTLGWLVYCSENTSQLDLLSRVLGVIILLWNEFPPNQILYNR
uniref:Uncharacterized protein n=1 Tax=Anguilla anguilla TaxID=7936 RepID=A0A0E9P7Q8_ANGAN